MVHWGKTKTKQKSASLNNKGNRKESINMQAWNYNVKIPKDKGEIKKPSAQSSLLYANSFYLFS